MIYEDFITKREIKLYFPNESNYQINKLFSEVRKHSDEIGVRMFSNITVPTKLFCDYWSLDYKKFLKTIEKEELKR